MEDNQEDGCPNSFCRANTSAGNDQTKVGDGGIGQNALRVALADSIKEHRQKVIAPTRMVIFAGIGHTWNKGASFTSRKTPALTMVEL